MAQLQSKLKKGDNVVVIAGKDKGRTGTISRVVTKTNRVVVDGVNLVKKHISQREAFRLQREPGMEQRPAPIHASNVMLADPKDGKPTRIGYKLDDKGNKVRYAKKSGETIDVLKKAADKKAAKKGSK